MFRFFGEVAGLALPVEGVEGTTGVVAWGAAAAGGAVTFGVPSGAGC